MYPVPCVWYQVLVPVLGTRCLVPATQYLVSGTTITKPPATRLFLKSLIPGTWISNVWNQPIVQMIRTPKRYTEQSDGGSLPALEIPRPELRLHGGAAGHCEPRAVNVASVEQIVQALSECSDMVCWCVHHTEAMTSAGVRTRKCFQISFCQHHSAKLQN